jgi:L-threonylcarbamoyladenylate synthase
VSALKRIDIMAGFTPEDVERAAALLRDGGIGVVPTDTVYGLVALATHEGAVARILEMKGREAGKPLPVQVASIREANILARADGPAAVTLADRFWPGALTLVLPRRTGPAAHLPSQPEESIGIRIPDDMFCVALIEHASYLVAPSANPAGAPAPETLDAVAPEIMEAVDFAVNGGACPHGVESTVVDLTAGVRVLREGAIAASEIMDALRQGGVDV